MPRTDIIPYDIPHAIWIGGYADPNPSCYWGSPIEMVATMAKELGPRVSIDDAIRTIIEDVQDSRGLIIQLPKQAPQRVRAAYLIQALLTIGCAREIPQA